MARSRKTKDILFKHARRRIRERYDIWLDHAMYDRMIVDIQKEIACFLGRESHTRTHWMLDGFLIAVYDSKRSAISTFLPPEAIDNYLPLGTFNNFNIGNRDLD